MKRAAKLASEIVVGDQMWIAHAHPSHVVVAETRRPTRGANKGRVYVRRASGGPWIVLDGDKTYPMVKAEATPTFGVAAQREEGE